MAKCEAAKNRRLKKKVCMSCNAKNALGATSCRKCSRSNLRMKAIESSK